MQATATTQIEIITAADVQRMLGGCRSSARTLLNELEARGLRRKGRSRATHYIRSEFETAYAELDMRP